jgi:pyridoxal phosphate enzyme (YggS family)
MQSGRAQRSGICGSAPRGFPARSARQRAAGAMPHRLAELPAAGNLAQSQVFAGVRAPVPWYVPPVKTLADRLAEVQQRIADAAQRSGRAATDVRMVAVTKYASVEAAGALVAAGCRDLGESRPQELWHKAAALADLPVRWHLVGHLQRNKVRRTLKLVQMIHSADSWRLLEALQRELVSIEHAPDVLLEVNISGDAAKHGFAPGELPDVLARLATLPLVRVRGLMAMASAEGGLSTARRNFADLRALRDRWRGACPPGTSLDELSMGMSGDFEVAIEEGATIVRIGSALFEGVA